jgi:hypothetical protein
LSLAQCQILLPNVLLADMYRKYGPLVKETVGGKTIVHVFDLGKFTFLKKIALKTIF